MLTATLPATTPQGTQVGRVCIAPVNLLSLFPTLTSLAGLPAKSDNDGPSLVPLLRDPQAAWPHVSITFLAQPGSYGLSAERWRFVHYTNGDEDKGEKGVEFKANG